MVLIFAHLISVTAVATTILQFLSGILVCKQYAVNGTTGEASPLPFIFGVLSSAIWFLYGLIKPDHNIVVVNTVGMSLMTCYVLVFYMYTVKKSSMLKIIFMTVLFIIFICGYSVVAEDYDLLLNRLGLLACSLTLMTVAAPLSKLLYVIRVKNTECLPFPMILMSFFVSTLWFMYGVLMEDVYLLLPNFIGGALAVCQLSLFVIYAQRPRSPERSNTILA